MTDTFPYTSFDRQNPAGSNALDSLAMYFQRLLYKEAIYPANLFMPLDTWYDKLYYGRVDQLQNTIIADLDNLVTIPTAAKPNLFALNFVVDAFEDFSSHMKNARIVGVLTDEGNNKIYDMKAYRAYEDPTALYDNYLQTLYTTFVQSSLLEAQNQLIDLKSFAIAYVAFLKKTASLVPVTKSGYLLTNLFSVMNSGLSIALDRGPAENDEYKYDNWINDPNFTFYVRSAKKFGFTVNKNIPWILTVDLFSNASLKYMRNYINGNQQVIDETNFFDTYYQKTYLTDVADLKNFIVNSYKEYIKANPYYEKEVRQRNCGKFQTKSFLRAYAQDPSDRDLPVIIPEMVVNQALSDKFLVDAYLDLRGAESQDALPISQKLRVELANIYALKPDRTLSSVQNASAYINLLYRDFIYTVDYLFLNENLLQQLVDNQARTGKIATVGSIVQQLY